MADEETKPTETPATVQATEPKSEIELLKIQLAKKNTDLEQVANSMLATIPENLKALIPEDLSPAAKVKWFDKAKETGIFNKVPVPETDNAKPSITPQQIDPSELPPIARMSRGYK